MAVIELVTPDVVVLVLVVVFGEEPRWIVSDTADIIGGIVGASAKFKKPWGMRKSP